MLAALEFRRPVLLLNGDTHAFVHDKPIPDAPNLTPVMVPGAGDVRAVQVTLDPEAAEPVALGLLGDTPAQPEPPPCAGYAPRMEAARPR